jgi:hypothetical protein
MSIQTQPVWSGENADRDGLGRIVDVLLPGTESLPSGREVGAHEALLDRVLEADPRLVVAVVTCGAKAGEVDGLDLETMRAWGEDQLEQVTFALTSAYYMSPLVRERLGYPGQQRRPIALATPEEVCSPELIAPVIARGNIYVPTPVHERNDHVDL